MNKTIFSIVIIALLCECIYAQKEKKLLKEYDGVRLEGQIEMPYSGTDLKLISFMGYNEGDSDKKKCDLNIRFYFPYSEQDSLFITANEIFKTNKFYFMSPIQKHWNPDSWQEFSNWPTKDVLVPLKIGIHEIGIIGRLNRREEGNGKIVPMNLYYSNLPDSITEYRIHFTTQNDLRKLKYKLLDGNTNDFIINNELINVQSHIINSITFRLSGRSAGPYILILDGELKYEPNKGPYREYEFFHNPNIKK